MLKIRLANVAVSSADSPFATPWVYPYAPVFWDTRSGAYFAHRLVSAAPTLIVTFFHDMIEAVTAPFMSGAQANRERDLRGRGEAIRMALADQGLEAMSMRSLYLLVGLGVLVGMGLGLAVLRVVLLRLRREELKRRGYTKEERQGMDGYDPDEA